MINKYFKRKEFSCQCGCGFDVVDVELLNILTLIRREFDKPVTITSGCRCGVHNETIGGVKSSQHTLGKAADIQVKNVDPSMVAAFIDSVYPDRYGIGTASNFVHIDVRSDRRRRWIY